MTRRTLMRSEAKSLDGAPQARLQVDRRLVAEDPLGLAQVGPRVPQVTGAPRQLAALHRLPDDRTDRLRDGVDARRRSGGNVEDLAVRALCVAGTDRRVDDVGDVREVARLLAVPVDVD